MHAADVSAHALLERNDPTLHALIGARAAGEREAASDALLETAHWLVSRIVRRFRRTEQSLGADDAEELTSSVLLRLLARLRRVPESESDAIASFNGYVATLTHNALHDFLRARYPERTRLKNKLRYVLTHDPRLALWSGEDDLVCGLAAWSGRTDVAELIAVDARSATRAMKDQEHPADAVAALLVHVGQPVAFSTLIRATMELWFVHESSSLRERGLEEAPPQLTMIESREQVAALWREIEALPPNQSAALLLNLRDAGGGNAVELFLLLDVASVAQLAAAMGMTEPELEQLWEKLPLDDRTIGTMLGLTRQQVINLRKAARARLGRRIAKDR